MCVYKAKYQQNASPTIAEEQSARRSVVCRRPQFAVAQDGRCSLSTRADDEATLKIRQPTPRSPRWMPHPIGTVPSCDGGNVISDSPRALSDARLPSKGQRRMSRRADTNYGFEMRHAADERKSANVVNTATVSDARSEQQMDAVADRSDLTGPEVTSSATADNQPPGNPEVVKEKMAGVSDQSEIPETENQEATVANPNNDMLDEAEKVDTSLGDGGQEAQPGGEDQMAADETEEDPFINLPHMAPYQEPPVFMGYSNYGFEFASSEKTSLATTENQNQPPSKCEVVKTKMTGVKNQNEIEIPERENEEATIESPDDMSEEDPFVDLPPMAPYQDPPVFRGQTNYGFEFATWATITETEEQTDDESGKSDNSDD